MVIRMASEPVSLDLSHDEALVLFEFVARYSESSQLEIADPAEQRVLWDICCLLERSLVEPLDPNYDDFLAAARERVRDEVG
jgi:hypothetical protein